MSTLTPADWPTKSIRMKSVPHVETARLVARREHLRYVALVQPAVSEIVTRHDFGKRVAELVLLEIEMLRRGTVFTNPLRRSVEMWLEAR